MHARRIGGDLEPVKYGKCEGNRLETCGAGRVPTPLTRQGQDATVRPQLAGFAPAEAHHTHTEAGMSRRIRKIVFVEPKSTHLHVYSRVCIPRLGSVLLGTLMRNLGYDVRVYIEEIQAPDMNEVL